MKDGDYNKHHIELLVAQEEFVLDISSLKDHMVK